MPGGAECAMVTSSCHSGATNSAAAAASNINNALHKNLHLMESRSRLAPCGARSGSVRIPKPAAAEKKPQRRGG